MASHGAGRQVDPAEFERLFFCSVAIEVPTATLPDIAEVKTRAEIGMFDIFKDDAMFRLAADTSVVRIAEIAAEVQIDAQNKIADERNGVIERKEDRIIRLEMLLADFKRVLYGGKPEKGDRTSITSRWRHRNGYGRCICRGRGD